MRHGHSTCVEQQAGQPGDDEEEEQRIAERSRLCSVVPHVCDRRTQTHQSACGASADSIRKLHLPVSHRFGQHIHSKVHSTLKCTHGYTPADRAA